MCIICVVAQVITRMGVVLPLRLGDPLTSRTRDLELLVLELWAGDARQKGSCGVVPWVSGSLGKWSGKQQWLVLSSSSLLCESNPATKPSLQGKVLCAGSHC